MEVPASAAEVPERQAFLARIQVRRRRPQGRQALERSTTGRLTEGPHQHCDTLAPAVLGPVRRAGRRSSPPGRGTRRTATRR
jgi:hypothetical protein